MAVIFRVFGFPPTSDPVVATGYAKDGAPFPLTASFVPQEEEESAAAAAAAAKKGPSRSQQRKSRRRNGPNDAFPVRHGYIPVYKREYPRRESKYRHFGCWNCSELDDRGESSITIDTVLGEGPKYLDKRMKEHWCPRFQYMVLAHAARLYRLGPDHEENKTGSIRLPRDQEARHAWYRRICRDANRKQTGGSGSGGWGGRDVHVEHLQDMYEDLVRRHGGRV
jgi:hypothetical protein